MKNNKPQGAIILAFGHRKRVGKDTAGKEAKRYLVERHGYTYSQVHVVGFADKLKDMCFDLYRWAGLKDRSWYEDYPEDRDKVLPFIGKTPRQIWIDFGTKAVRDHVYSSTWCDYLLYSYHDWPGVMLITDLRFPDEFTAVRERGGYCVRLVREPYADAGDVADLALESQDRWYATITAASGDVEGLKSDVREVVDRIMSDRSWLDTADRAGVWPRIY